MTPLYFQAVKSETASQVGQRLIVPALGFPIGAVGAGWVMSKYGRLAALVRLGCFVLLVGCLLLLSLDRDGTNSEWVYFFNLIPFNIGSVCFHPIAVIIAKAVGFGHSQARHCESQLVVHYAGRFWSRRWGIRVTLNRFRAFVHRQD
jgi:MFS family permease